MFRVNKFGTLIGWLVTGASTLGFVALALSFAFYIFAKAKTGEFSSDDWSVVVSSINNLAYLAAIFVLGLNVARVFRKSVLEINSFKAPLVVILVSDSIKLLQALAWPTPSFGAIGKMTAICESSDSSSLACLLAYSQPKISAMSNFVLPDLNGTIAALALITIVLLETSSE